METKVLVIGVVKKGKNILLRKKVKGSPPYKETWYMFGDEITAEKNVPEKILINILNKQTNIKIKPIKKLGWDTEIKPDHEGNRTFYIYLDYLCEYVSGKLVPSAGIEKLEWIPISKLSKYDIVPPSRKLLKKLGYL